jgi:hypothetical protein
MARCDWLFCPAIRFGFGHDFNLQAHLSDPLGDWLHSDPNAIHI